MRRAADADIQDLQPQVKTALRQLDSLVTQAGGSLRVNSGYRSLSQQQKLYANRENNPYPVAPPGQSDHQLGSCLDLGVSGITQDHLAQLAGKVGLKWAGDSDPVHFDYTGSLTGQGDPMRYAQRGPLTGQGDAQTAQFQKNLEQVGQGRNRRLADEQAIRETIQAGMPAQQAEPQQDPDIAATIAAGSGGTPEPQNLWDRAKNYTSNWYNSVVHGQTNGGEELNPFERASAAVSPLLQGADYIGGGGLGQLTGWWQGGLLTGLGRAYNTVKAPIAYAGGQLMHNLDIYGERGTGPMGSLNNVTDADVLGELKTLGQKAADAWGGKPGPGVLEGTLSGEPELAETIKAYPALKALVQATDFGIDWEAMPAFIHNSPIAPVFRIAGKAVRLGTDAVANRADLMAGRLQEAGNEGLARKAYGANEMFKRLTNATPEFRQAQEYVKQNKQIESTARQLQDRYTNTVLNISRKMQAQGKDIEGDFLTDHPDPAIAEQAGGNKGNLVVQALLHGVEAGDDGSFFNSPEEVLQIAADKGIPVKPLAQAIEEMKSVSEMAGQQMVKHNLLDPETFAEHQGTYARRFYRLNLNDPMHREALIQELLDKGVDTTRANNIVMSLQQAGESGPEGQTGAGLKQRGNTGNVQQRKLLSPEDRMQFLPEYNALDSVNNSLLGQFRAAAVHGALANIAGDAGLSAANQIINAGQGRVLQLSDTNRIKNMRNDVAEDIKSHQDSLTNGLEKVYNSQQKWVGDQQSAVQKASELLAEHQLAEPQKPQAPLLPQKSNAPLSGQATPITREVEPGTRTVNTGQAVYKPDLQAIIDQIESGHREIGRAKGEALPHNERVSDVMNITREEATPGRTENTGLTFKKPYLPNIVQSLKDAAEKAAYDKSSRQWVQDLADWQGKHEAWQKRAANLAQDVTDRQTELARRQGFLDKTDQQVADWFAKGEQLERRHDLLNGAAPTDLHANDALTQIEQKLGFEIADPAERQKWFDIWKDKWGSRGQDIFDSNNLTAPESPKGIPPELMRHVDQNIIPAVALDDTLSADAGAYNNLNHPPGWELWEGKGNRDYGAMEGRWGPVVVRQLVEDAIDPSRFIRDSLAHPMLKWAGVIAKEFKALRLYYNLPTRAHIMIQSFWDAKASANSAGVAFDPAAYIRGMKEYKSWVEGDGKATPAVQAMLQGSGEIGAGHFGTVYPEELPKIGQEGTLRRFANNSQKKFLEAHQFPKAGLAAVLTDSGMSPQAVGQLADQAFVTRGPYAGGIETHGVQQIAEGLNRYGVAIFTSYPLHSINRFFQLMATKPEVFAPYPVLRNYLFQMSGPQAAMKDQEGEVKPSMVPIPGLKDSRGNPVWVDAGNLVPYGAAMRENAFGNGYKSIVDRFQDEQQRMQQMGANPSAISDEAIRQAFFTVAPSEFRQADVLSRSLNGNTTAPYAVTPPTPLMALSPFAGLPMRYIEDATGRKLGLNKSAIPSRQQFYELYVQRLQEGKDTPADSSGHLQKLNPQSLYMAQSAAKRYLMGLFSDKSLDERNANKQIRHQVDYILSINKRLQDQATMAAQQSQEGEGNNEGF